MIEIGALLNQRYQVVDEIGRGGMGIIYRGHDVLLDRDVAIKVLNKTNLGVLAYQRLLNEAKAIARLNHPNIVAVYDAGEIGDSPYFVMELLEGEVLTAEIARPIHEVVSIGLQICAALEHAHAHNIIHRDLKPGNVIMLPGGHLKLMDFGVARAGVSKFTLEGEILGTLFYLAPEQALGSDIDARVDLYALGVIFYELLTGALPFVAEDWVAVISQHLNQPVTPPSQKNPQIPASLDSLVLRLLSKKRENRPPSASAVHQELTAISEELGVPVSSLNHTSTGVISPPAAPVGTAPRPMPAFLAGLDQSQPAPPPMFVCRDQELDLLGKALATMMAGQGGVRFIAGDAGIGKTTLVNEFARRARETHPDLVVAMGRCNAVTGVGDPFSPFRNILCMLTGDFESEWAAGAISRNHAIQLWDLLPVAAKALVERGPNLIGSFVPLQSLTDRIHFHQSLDKSDRYGLGSTLGRKLELKGRGIPQQSHILDEFTQVVQAIAQTRPLVLVLDDLQWADASSVSLLFYLGRRITRSRILVLGTYRPQDLIQDTKEEPRPILEVLSEFKRELGDIWIYLESGDQQSARHFVDAVLDVSPNLLDEEFRRQLATVTGGHPLFTQELIKDLQDRGDILKDERGFWVKGPRISWDILPARVEGVIEKRIERLDQSLREVLAAASVEGMTFTAEVIAHVIHRDEGEIIQKLSGELVEKHRLIIEGRSRQIDSSRLSQFTFRHNLIQRYLYNNLGSARHRYLHEAVGAELEKIYGNATDEIALQLAHHFQQVGNSEKAVYYLFRAGVRALKLSAPGEAVVHLSKALDQIKANPEVLGSSDGSVKESPQLQDHPAGQLFYIQIERRLGEAYLGLGDLSASLVHLENLTSLLGRPIPSSQKRLYTGLTRQTVRQVLHLVRLLPFQHRSVESSPYLIELVRAYNLISEIYILFNKPLPLIYSIITTLNLAERLEPTSELSLAYAGMASIVGLIPIHSLANLYFKRARLVADYLNSPFDQASIRLVSGLYHSGAGNFSKANQDLENALDVFEHVGDQLRIGETLAILAVMVGLHGDLARFEQLFKRILSMAVSKENELFKAWALVALAELSLKRGETESVVEKLKEAQGLLKKNIDRTEDIRAAGLLAKAYLSAGKVSLALEAAEAGYQLIQESMPPTVFSMIVGYAGVAEVYMRLWEMQRETPEVIAMSEPELHLRAKRSITMFYQFSRFFKIGQPYKFLWAGSYEWQMGNQAKALSLWTKGLQAAERLAMPYEQGLLHYEMARRLEPGNPQRDQHIQGAEEIFSRLGTTYNLSRVQELAGRS